MKKGTLANFAAASAALSAGASVVATRLVVAETDPVTLAFYRYVIATICIAPVLIARWPTCSMPMRDTATIASLGALFFGFFPWAFSAALQDTTAARGAIGIATIPIQTLILAVFFGREVLTYAKLLSVSLALVGVVVAFGSAALSIKRSDYLIGERAYVARCTERGHLLRFRAAGLAAIRFSVCDRMWNGVRSLGSAPSSSARRCGLLSAKVHRQRLVRPAVSRDDRGSPAVWDVHVGPALVAAHPHGDLSDTQPDVGDVPGRGLS
jgi:hypothetical protein